MAWKTTHNIHAHLRNGAHIEMGWDGWVQIFPNNVHNRGLIIEFIYFESSLEAQSRTVISCNKDMNLKFKI